VLVYELADRLALGWVQKRGWKLDHELALGWGYGLVLDWARKLELEMATTLEQRLGHLLAKGLGCELELVLAQDLVGTMVRMKEHE
jgi:hypothetical protein